jgi:hypothetical protein
MASAWVEYRRNRCAAGRAVAYGMWLACFGEGLDPGKVTQAGRQYCAMGQLEALYNRGKIGIDK